MNGKFGQRLALQVWELDPNSVGIIVPSKSGLVWEQQAGGHSCHWHELEGEYVSLGAMHRQLMAHFYGPSSKWRGWCCEGIDFETADFLESYLRQTGTDFVSVDRCQLGESEEAWVYVNLLPNRHPQLFAHGGKSCVLTWENSD